MQTNRILTSFIVLFLLSSISSPASGDHVWDHRYTISGEVTTQGGNGVYWMPVSVDCSDENATDPSICSLNSGREDSTGLFGSYSIQLHIHTADQGKLLVLDVNGERVEHIIDVTGLDGVQDEEDRFADLIKDIHLEYDLENKGSGYIFNLYVHSSVTGQKIAVINVTTRYTNGQMDGIGSKSNYKLYAKDWSDIFGDWK